MRDAVGASTLGRRPDKEMVVFPDINNLDVNTCIRIVLLIRPRPASVQ